MKEKSRVAEAFKTGKARKSKTFLHAKKKKNTTRKGEGGKPVLGSKREETGLRELLHVKSSKIH